MKTGIENARGVFRKVYGDKRSLGQRLYEAFLMLVIGSKVVVVNAKIRGTLEIADPAIIVNTTFLEEPVPRLRYTCE